MKYLKQKLMAAVSMMLVAAVMMSTSTYAWFAISTAPEVADVTTTISSTGAFEIALGTVADDEPDDTALGDTGNDTTWGATVTTVDGFSGLEFPITADDTDATGASGASGYYTVEYGADGRPEEDLVDVTFKTYTYADGIADITSDITVGTEIETKVVASSVLLWLRTNVDVTDAVVTASDITILDEDEKVVATDDADKTVDILYTSDAPLSVADIGVAIVMDGVTYESGETLSSFTANTATDVELMVYLEGANVSNATLGEEFTITIGTVTFTSETIDDVGVDATT